MISATEAKQLTTPITLEEIEGRIKQNAQQGGTDTCFPMARWNPEIAPALVDAGYVIRRGGIDNNVVIVEWK